MRHRKQSVKNKKCFCGLQPDEAKKSKKVRYWISYRTRDGNQRRESVGAFEDLDAYFIEDAEDAMAYPPGCRRMVSFIQSVGHSVDQGAKKAPAEVNQNSVRA